MKLRLLAACMLLAAAVSGPAETMAQNNNKPTPCQFRTDMRQLWEDHITWTRNVILNIIDTLPGTNEAVGRLLQNQVDIGNAIKPYYGNAAGDQLTSLLTHHITIAADILIALRTGNTTLYNTANTDWFLNADSIAAFLAGANPHWSLNDLTMMMHDHLNATAAEALARLNMDYAADVTAYDNVHMQAMEMADMLSMGITMQFPNKFKGGSAMRVTLSGEGVSLSQNAPNPFTESTTIAYYLPDDVKTAQITVHDVTGRLMRTIDIQERGAGELIIEANHLPAGTYTYSILADGSARETRKMIHLR